MEFRKPSEVSVKPVERVAGKPSIGQQVFAARTAKGWTQMQLWEHSRVALYTISGLERGTITQPNAKTIVKLQNALGIIIEI